MITSISHKGLYIFFTTGKTIGINPQHSKRLRLILAKLHTAHAIQDLVFPGSNLHPLKGNKKGYWSIQISGNWRVIFKIKEKDAFEIFDVDYLDYH